MTAIRLALINSHPVLIEGLKLVLERTGRFIVTSTGDSGSDALRILEAETPDVLILDVENEQALHAVVPAATAAGVKTVVYTACADAEAARRALNSGANGYVLTRTPPAELIASVDAALRAEIYVSSALAGSLLGVSRQKQQEPATLSSRLSHREEQIVKMLLLGKKNRDIASDLNLSEKTVKCYMTGLMQKLNARSRLEVVLVVQQQSQTGSVSKQSGLPQRSREMLDFAAAE